MATGARGEQDAAAAEEKAHVEALGAVAAPRLSEAATASLASRRHAIISTCCRVSFSRAPSGRGSRAASLREVGDGDEGQEIEPRWAQPTPSHYRPWGEIGTRWAEPFS